MLFSCVFLRPVCNTPPPMSCHCINLYMNWSLVDLVSNVLLQYLVVDFHRRSLKVSASMTCSFHNQPSYRCQLTWVVAPSFVFHLQLLLFQPFVAPVPCFPDEIQTELICKMCHEWQIIAIRFYWLYGTDRHNKSWTSIFCVWAHQYITVIL